MFIPKTAADYKKTYFLDHHVNYSFNRPAISVQVKNTMCIAIFLQQINHCIVKNVFLKNRLMKK